MLHVKHTQDEVKLLPKDLFQTINDLRQFAGKPPVERMAMASRCTIKFNLRSGSYRDFTQPEVWLGKDQIPLLESLLSQQFGIRIMGNRISRLCRPLNPTQPPPPQTSKALVPSRRVTNKTRRIGNLFSRLLPRT